MHGDAAHDPLSRPPVPRLTAPRRKARPDYGAASGCTDAGRCAAGKTIKSVVARRPSGDSLQSSHEGGTLLVLTRRAGEKIVINGGICITVVAISGNNVRLGVAAPETIRVDRAEVADREGNITRRY